jgi:8-oxo-dGTP pyrophosphatase MutT (NUDIX family)
MTNNSYKNENAPPQDLKACAGVIVKTIVGRKKYLVVKQSGGLYGFPKGHMNTSDKNLKDTAIRELKEETGLVIEKLEKDTRHYDIKNVKLFTHYIPKIITTLISNNNEIESIHWFTIEEMLQLSENKQTNLTINEFLRQNKPKHKSKMFTGFCKTNRPDRPHLKRTQSPDHISLHGDRPSHNNLKREKNWRSA